MALAHRVIPTILCRGRQLVKGRQFAANRVVGHAAQAVQIHNRRGVDELVLLDIGATPEGRGPDLELVRELSEACFMPLAVGGGVRSLEDVQKLLRSGADKVVIGTAVYGPSEVASVSIVNDIATRFGSQAVVVSIDCLHGEVYTHGGRTRQFRGSLTCDGPVPAARRAASHGAGEILLTSIDREGTMTGYDLDLIREVSAAVSIPVIANGGCSGPSDMLAAIRAGASACAAGALFQFSDVTPRDCARYLAENGVEARVP